MGIQRSTENKRRSEKKDHDAFWFCFFGKEREKRKQRKEQNPTILYRISLWQTNGSQTEINQRNRKQTETTQSTRRPSPRCGIRWKGTRNQGQELSREHLNVGSVGKGERRQSRGEGV